jgi:predicted DNA-binding transcriptional regulator AlpA
LISLHRLISAKRPKSEGPQRYINHIGRQNGAETDERKNRVTKVIDYKALRPEKGISFSYMQTMRLVEAGKFPKPIKIGNRNYWVVEELDSYIADLTADRDGLPRPPVPMPDYVRRFAQTLPKDAASRPQIQEAGGNQRADAGGFDNSKLEGSEYDL